MNEPRGNPIRTLQGDTVRLVLEQHQPPGYGWDPPDGFDGLYDELKEEFILEDAEYYELSELGGFNWRASGDPPASCGGHHITFADAINDLRSATYRRLQALASAARASPLTITALKVTRLELALLNADHRANTPKFIQWPPGCGDDTYGGYRLVESKPRSPVPKAVTLVQRNEVWQAILAWEVEPQPSPPASFLAALAAWLTPSIPERDGRPRRDFLEPLEIMVKPSDQGWSTWATHLGVSAAGDTPLQAVEAMLTTIQKEGKYLATSMCHTLNYKDRVRKARFSRVIDSEAWGLVPQVSDRWLVLGTVELNDYSQVFIRVDEDEPLPIAGPIGDVPKEELGVLRRAVVDGDPPQIVELRPVDVETTPEVRRQ